MAPRTDSRSLLMILLQPSPVPELLCWHYSYKALMSSIPLWSERKGSGKTDVISVQRDLGAWKGWPQPPIQPASGVRWPTTTRATAQPAGLTCVERGIIWGCWMAPSLNTLLKPPLSKLKSQSNISVMITLPGWLVVQQEDKGMGQQPSRQAGRVAQGM